jgi:hypothetical protein
VFSAYAGPRVKGLISFFRFANMKILARFAKIGKALNRAGIPMLLFKGGAMKVLRPAMHRPMGDVDVLVPRERLDEAVRVCESLGCRVAARAPHGVDIHTAADEPAVDIHHVLFDTGCDSGAFHRGLIGRAAPACAFGVDVLLPAREDLLFLILNNLIKNTREFSSPHSLFFSLLDCRWLLAGKPDFDWAIVRGDADATGTGIFVRLAAELLNQMVSGLLPGFDMPVPPELESYCEKFLAEEEYFSLRLKARAWAAQVRGS